MGTRRQHTIPNFYLKKFLNPGFVYRRGERSPRFVKRPKNVAVRFDYYGGQSAGFDALDKLNSMTENWAAPVLQRLVGDVASITQADWLILSYYFANIHIRTPAFQDTMINTFKEMNQKLSEMAGHMKEAYEKARAEGKDLSVFSRPPLDDSPRYSMDEWNRWMDKLDQEEGRLDTISVFYSLVKDVAACIKRMSFHMCEAPGGLFFVTTDRPLVLFSLISGSPLGAGWGNADALAVLPLDPKHLLAMSYRDEQAVYHMVLPAKHVHFWNIELMKYAVCEVYSRHEYDLALDWMLGKGIWKPERVR